VSSSHPQLFQLQKQQLASSADSFPISVSLKTMSFSYAKLADQPTEESRDVGKSCDNSASLCSEDDVLTVCNSNKREATLHYLPFKKGFGQHVLQLQMLHMLQQQVLRMD